MRFTRNRTTRTVFMVMFISVLVIGIVSLVWHVGASGPQTYATVVYWDRDWVGEDFVTHAIVQYEVDGVVYEGVLEYLTGSIRGVDRIRISYNPDNPREIEVAYGSWIVWLIPAIGLAGIILEQFVLVLIRRKRRKEQL